ncbi:MAG: ABC transporter ATP-binding protein [Candidatus Lambdaproteobacteria bacterium RIFOXYD1_FULL_56_27]|uniref:ABC transporter ATP-binding protein n=1 Tax=Candidatus Lambdaproteobacteria bacterium RIFOXYD2_FULL_56_26 TaxID=1817773 RepID=A0A1F6GX91_9PROT|nr:MAG: ABC transporter ATP-binding protein [Candidatus Lambdaproteobacteria bacterium RIFOXYC1_FULL_56_13]OGH02689.1 MAG: ABC transporter ATP-binding protein [Candidatus Lambdaproteobacteria bacterium RIFOXYD2_FULL_56_26]OGH07990.1 MAG: ABC transporter ATP-binding protein [Candidatus Lambdaproteobacteria bacterium RIFOXYD1_FULL_56_27]
MREAVIELKGVVKRFGPLLACDHLDLTLYRGEYVGLLGPNGAGKTTLVEMIEGLQKPDSGEIKIFGKTWSQASKELQGRMGISFQETRFFDKLSVEETLRLFSSLYGGGNERIEKVLGQVALKEKRKTYTVNLSGGQRQRLALGLALLNEPEVLLLDEPTTGLDPNSRRDLWEILQEIRTQGTTLILTTHYMEEAETLCDRILFMDQGKVLADGSLSELLTSMGLTEMIQFELDQPMDKTSLPLELKNLPFELEPGLKKGQVRVEKVIESLPAFLHWIEERGHILKELQSRRMTLDDLFVSMTGRGLTEDD